MVKKEINTVRTENGYEMINVKIEASEHSKSKVPLLEAGKNCDLEALRNCIENGEDILQIGDGSSTVLHYVSYGEHFENAIACTEAIIYKAKQNSNLGLLQKLLDAENIFKRTALGNAAIRGNARLMKILLDHGAKVDITKRNETIFHTIAKLKNEFDAISCLEIALNLKYYRNDPDKLVEYLNIEDCNRKRTALHLVVIFGNYTLIEPLIKHGSDPSKVDFTNSNVFHHAFGNAFEDKAVKSAEILLKPNLIHNWKKNLPNLLEATDISGRCPIHIAARRGFHGILGLIPKCYLLFEANTGFTPLHAAASLGDEEQAELCVKEILHHADPERKSELCNAQDSEGRTPLYLSAKERNVEACKLLLLAGSGFDIKTKRGKTPLEKVYEKIPQAVTVLLDKAVKNSGYVAYFRTINTVAELDFGPILGYSTSKSNIYKETNELAKVCSAKFGNRKAILHHPFIQIYIHEKWEKMKWFFHIFRFLHILWFFFNCIFVVWTYRYVCPIPGAKNFTWTGLRPTEDNEEMGLNKTLAECEIPIGLRGCGYLNLLTVLVYFLCALPEMKQNYQQIFYPTKSRSYHNCLTRCLLYVAHYVKVFYQVLPIGPLLFSVAITLTILPTLGFQPLTDFNHYFIAGMVGLGVWVAICLEAMKIPKFSFYKNLLWRSAKTLLVAITVTAPILFGFAALFAILIPAEPAFSSPAQSLVKVITFMIGELDYGSLVYGETNSIFLGWVMLFMALFILIIVVLLVNFLIGLAAEEIRDVWDRAVIWSLCTKLEQIHALESFLDDELPLARSFLRNKFMLMPPEREVGEEIGRQIRRARIKIPNLRKELQKEFHQLRLPTILEVKQL